MFRKFTKMLSTAARKVEKKPFTVIIEGNIGSGKTTFLDYFQKYDNVCILSEPVTLWRDCSGHNLLAQLYDNPSRWAFTFQSYVQLTMLQQHLQPTQLPVKLLERSIYSARYCFVEKLARDGTLPGPSLAVLHEWFKHITSQFDLSVDLIVYLRTTPEVVHERVLARGRPEERGLSLRHVQDLHDLHEEWLHRKTGFECPAPVLSLNADLDRARIVEEYEKCQNTVFEKIRAV